MEMTEGMVMMKDGKMMLVKDGKMLPMELDMTMSDGTKVMTTGVIMRPNGTTRQMADGEVINKDGEMANIDDSAKVDEEAGRDDLTRMVD